MSDYQMSEVQVSQVEPLTEQVKRFTLVATDISCLGKVHPAENMRELTGNLRECRNFQQEKGRETSN